MHVSQLVGPGWLMYRTQKQWCCNPAQKMNRCAGGGPYVVSERMQTEVCALLCGESVDGDHVAAIDVHA